MSRLLRFFLGVSSIWREWSVRSHQRRRRRRRKKEKKEKRMVCKIEFLISIFFFLRVILNEATKKVPFLNIFWVFFFQMVLEIK